MESIKVFKIGGNVVDNPEALAAFVRDFTSVSGSKVLIHGGGKEATRLCSRLEIPTVMLEGRRVTDAATLDVVTMVYAGLINKRIVALLQDAGCNAIGLSGADADTIRAVKRPSEPVDYGFVGDINSSSIRAPFIIRLLEAGLTPVFSAITHDGEGLLLNCNADSIAMSVATALAADTDTDVELYYCFEQKGVMRDISDSESLIPLLTAENYPALKEEGIISGGMIPKIENALKAVSEGVRSVYIKNAADILLPSGTCITSTK